jgi:hypothetical protein
VTGITLLTFLFRIGGQRRRLWIAKRAAEPLMLEYQAK